MDEGFNLRSTTAGSFNFLQGQLTSQNAALHASAHGKVHTTAIGDGHLGAGVQGQLRHDLAC